MLIKVAEVSVDMVWVSGRCPCRILETAVPDLPVGGILGTMGAGDKMPFRGPASQKDRAANFTKASWGLRLLSALPTFSETGTSGI